jgi:hypothetical protein
MRNLLIGRIFEERKEIKKKKGGKKKVKRYRTESIGREME